MMLVIALLVAIGGISVPVYQVLQVKNDLDVAAYTVAQTLRRAQVLSQSGTEDSVWGVRVEEGGVILFKGANFAGRDQSFDEVAEISSNMVLSGIQEVIYSKVVGEPQTTGGIVLTTSNNDVKTITINAKGIVEY
mgnify:FL=1